MKLDTYLFIKSFEIPPQVSVFSKFDELIVFNLYDSRDFGKPLN